MRRFEIAVFEGDGIGPEVTAPTLELLTTVGASQGLAFDFRALPAGAGHYLKTGEALPEASVEAAKAADAILLAAAGLPGVRYPDGTEIVPQITLRILLRLYAGVRPVFIPEGWPTPLASQKPVDFVLVRESTEGLFHTMGEGLVTEDQAEETLRITRETTSKLSAFAFDLAARRKAEGRSAGRVTCIDKANVFRAFAFMREVFLEEAAKRPEITADAAYVDAFALWMVQRLDQFDVAITENMFGDILSDLGAGLMGGLGVAPSADIGDGHAVFQPCHGTAPDIMGEGKANPMAMILSGAMMLDWLGETKGCPEASAAGEALRAAGMAAIVDRAAMTGDLGGTASTGQAAEAVAARL
ncbi:MAG: isocitrate/isopropylmalate family dehydrogenase [Pseudomonadota bacterium]